jgi:alpha-ketoglutarate-dependent 2,4-dichlorophenoxyacetate dioxygenase
LGISIRQLKDAVAGEVTGVDCRAPLSADKAAALHADMDQYALFGIS